MNKTASYPRPAKRGEDISINITKNKGRKQAGCGRPIFLKSINYPYISD